MEQCIATGEEHLLSHPDDEDGLFLMAIAEVYDAEGAKTMEPEEAGYGVHIHEKLNNKDYGTPYLRI
ncbi:MULTISPECIES: hypothetical protein [unclassified Chryseobacterium]|uniref:hypothetical protein n=1 Tax=unclassified Chryseobacterium TaxID=2593645 RepID=UPI0011CEBCDD|nr:hypothetical protein [Chryseobacterium sp. G0240]